MTVKLLDEIKRFQGLSTDTKPTGADVVVGSMFFEEDTGQSFKYTGSIWVCDPTNPGLLSSLNSTTQWLGAGIAFTGTAEDITNIAVIIVTVFADEDSATDGLSVEFSHDGTNWDNTDVFTIPANTGKTFSFQPSGKYFRVVYTNGGVFQSVFRLSCYLKTTYVKPSSHRIQDGISGQDDAELVKAVLTGEDASTTGNFNNVKTTADGNLRIVDAGSGLAIAKGEVNGTTFIHKFGNAPDFDTADGIVSVWDGADDADIAQMVYQYSTTADIDSISSSVGADTQNIEIQGLDTNYDVVLQTITLTGQARKALDTSLIRVFRMKNIGTTSNAGHVYCYVNTAIGSGVPADSTKVRAVLQPLNNQTLMAIYTIPSGKTGYMRDWFAASAGSNKDTNYIVELRARSFGQVFQLKHKSSLSDVGTSHIQHVYVEPEIFLEKTDIEMRVSAAAVGATAASVSAGFDVVLVDN